MPLTQRYEDTSVGKTNRDTKQFLVTLVSFMQVEWKNATTWRGEKEQNSIYGQAKAKWWMREGNTLDALRVLLTHWHKCMVSLKQK